MSSLYVVAARDVERRKGNVFTVVCLPTRGVLQSLVPCLAPSPCGKGVPQPLVPGPFWWSTPIPVIGSVQSPVPGPSQDRTGVHRGQYSSYGHIGRISCTIFSLLF